MQIDKADLLLQRFYPKPLTTLERDVNAIAAFLKVDEAERAAMLQRMSEEESQATIDETYTRHRKPESYQPEAGGFLNIQRS